MSESYQNTGENELADNTTVPFPHRETSCTIGGVAEVTVTGTAMRSLGQTVPAST